VPELKKRLRPVLTHELQEHLFISERQMVVAHEYLINHKSQKEIAEQLGVSQSTISTDIRKILEEYSMKRLNKMQLYLNVELAKLDAVEKAAWLAWERSIGKTVKIVTRTNSTGFTEEVRQEEELVGDPRFLTQVQTAIDRRIKLLGLDAPQEILLNTMEGRLTRLIKEGKVTYDMLVVEVGDAQARRYFNLAGIELPNIVEGQLVEINDLEEIYGDFEDADETWD